jgi:hypothetical protein
VRGRAGRDASEGAYSKFNYRGLMVFEVDSTVNYYCDLVENYYSDAIIARAKKGKNGVQVPNLKNQAFKISETTRIEEQVHEFCKLAVFYAELEKSRLESDFLVFIFSLQEANIRVGWMMVFAC